MPEFKVEVEFQVWCSCGEGLCFQSQGLDEGKNKIVYGVNTYGPGVIVEPCPKCMERAKAGKFRPRKIKK